MQPMQGTSSINNWTFARKKQTNKLKIVREKDRDFAKERRQ